MWVDDHMNCSSQNQKLSIPNHEYLFIENSQMWNYAQNNLFHAFF